MNRRKGVKYYDGQMCSKLSASGHDASIVVSVVNKLYRFVDNTMDFRDEIWLRS